MKKEVTITFETITPLWTGDAWQDNREIRPSSLIGSLRFWFAFYWKIVKEGTTEKLNEKGIPMENLAELENSKKNRTFRIILKEKIKEVNNFDEAIDKTLDELGLSVPSRIFGCTGWKSRIKIEIEDFKGEDIEFNRLEFKFPLNKLQQNSNQLSTKFWIKRILFKDDDSKPLKLFLFKDIKVKLTTSNYWWETYLEDFFNYFKDKLILVGGKNSLGFGFVNLRMDDNSSFPSTISSVDDWLKIVPIYISYTGDKKVLGFNFKYFLRKKEKKEFREQNFGKQGKASKIYVSNLLKNRENDKSFILILLVNNPFEEFGETGIPPEVFSKYVRWLSSLNQEVRDNE